MKLHTHKSPAQWLTFQRFGPCLMIISEIGSTLITKLAERLWRLAFIDSTGKGYECILQGTALAALNTFDGFMSNVITYDLAK